MVHVLFPLCVKMRNNVQFAPNASLYTAGHSIHPDSRNSGYEYGIGITLGNPARLFEKLLKKIVNIIIKTTYLMLMITMASLFCNKSVSMLS
jgi:hypothetical protein